MKNILKILSNILILLTVILINAESVSADNLVAEGSAQINLESDINDDYRYFTLKSYLDKHNSPLSDYAYVFIDKADEYEIDWRLVAAISGVESTFGKHIPINSYNAYGWANGNYSFKNWEESIEIVTKTLKEKYIDNGAITTYQIGRIYAPPSPSWAWKVEYFMNQIDPVSLEFTL